MKKNRLAIIIAVLFITIFTNFLPAFAEGGEQANSPGIPGQKPLNLVSVTLEDGSSINTSSGITTKPKFKLTFDKNVVNMLYWENNAKCFSIVSASGQVVPISVTKIDDTVDFSMRQIIFIQPTAELKTGTSYVIKISPELTAKNGIKLGGSTSGKGMTVSFKTEGVAPSTGTATAVKSTVTKSAAASTTTKTSTSTVQPVAVAATTTAKASNNTNVENTKTTATSGSTAIVGNAAGTGKASTAADTDTGVNAQNNVKSEKAGSGIGHMLNWGVIALVLGIGGWAAVEFIIKRRKVMA